VPEIKNKKLISKFNQSLQRYKSTIKFYFKFKALPITPYQKWEGIHASKIQDLASDKVEFLLCET
jgi:hypothetical protein